MNYEDLFLNYANNKEWIKCKEILLEAINKLQLKPEFALRICELFKNATNIEELELLALAYPIWTSQNKKEDLRYHGQWAMSMAYRMKQGYNKTPLEIDDEILEAFEILIPTYNRKDILIRTIQDIKQVNPKINIVVSDNASEDGTYEALLKLQDQYENFKIFKNEKNLGFSGNIFQVIKQSSKKFILLTSDEEPAIIENLVEAIEFARQNKSGMLIPVNFRISKSYELNTGKKDRGYSYLTFVFPRQYRAVAQYSGIVYEGKILRKFLSKIEKYLSVKGYTYHYLFYSILVCIYCDSNFFYPKPLVYTKEYGKRYVEATEGEDHIYHVVERWYQFKMIMSFLKEIKEEYNLNLEEQTRLNEIIKTVVGNIFPHLFGAAGLEFPAYKDFFQYIARNDYEDVKKQNEILTNINKKAIMELEALQMDIVNNKLNTNKQEKDNKTIQINQIKSKLDFQTKYGTAKERIKNQLSYKLGQAMINNSKSLLGYIRMPYVLSYIKETHQREQETYQQSIKQNPNLKLPPLESYADYQEALKIKNHLTYKLGAALIKANNVRGGGRIFAYIGFLKEVRRLKSEYRNK